MSLLKNFNFTVLLSGQLVSTLGNNLFNIALPWYVYTLTNSKTALALTGITGTLPAIVGLFAGVLVDRWRKRTTMIVSDVIRALISFALVAAVIAKWPFWSLLLMVLALQTVGQFFGPASAAFFPLLVEPEEVTAGSGMMQSSNATAQLIGTVTGGALMAVLGAPLLFLFDGLSFTVSVVSLLFIRVKEVITQSAGDAKSASSSFLRDWLEGISLLSRSKFLVLVIVAALVTNAALAPLDVTMTAWVKGPLHGTAFNLGLINGGFFIGIIVGGILLGWVAQKVPLRAVLVFGLVAIGVCSSAFGLFHNPWPDVALTIISGFAAGSLNGSLGAMFIQLIPAEIRGRAFGLIGALATIAMPVGMTVFGALMVRLPLPVVFALMGALCTVSGLSLLLPVRNDTVRLGERVPGTTSVAAEAVVEVAQGVEAADS